MHYRVVAITLLFYCILALAPAGCNSGDKTECPSNPFDDSSSTCTSSMAPVCQQDSTKSGTSITLTVPKKRYDAFISYRRKGGSHLSSLILMHLLHENPKLRIYQDVVNVGNGKLREQMLDSINASKNFILILTQNALDGLRYDAKVNDWLHLECKTAITAEIPVNIIPVADEEFIFPDKNQLSALPVVIQDVLSHHVLKWYHEHQTESARKIISRMQI